MSLKHRKVLVTGSNGFIGGHLARRLRAENADVLYWSGKQASDLRNMKACEYWMKGIEVVYHCAGVTAGAGVVVGDPLALVYDNLVIAANVFEAARRCGVKTVIFPSSTTGYPPVEYPVTEDEYHGELFAGYRTIGTVKRFVEDLATLYPMKTVALRISNVFGPEDQFDPIRSHVIQATIRKVAERQDPLVVWGDGYDVRDALYIDDVVEAFVRAGERADELIHDLHPAFNIGRGRGYSIREILGILLLAEGYEPEVRYDETKPTLLKKRLVDVEKAFELFGWKAEVSMEDALARTLAWYKEHKR